MENIFNDQSFQKFKSSQNRINKAEKIITILNDHINSEFCHLNCLDIGCADGIMLNRFSEIFDSAIGIDMNSSTLMKSSKLMRPNTSQILGNCEYLPFPQNYFDVVICAQVYEHVSNQTFLAQEIFRVTKQNGVVFFSGPNKLAIMEEHYWLPFLSWFPIWISNIYMRVAKKGFEYDIKPLNIWQLRKLWQCFHVEDYTQTIFMRPEKYFTSDQARGYSFLNHFPSWIIKLLKPLYPNFNWILYKTREKF